MYLLCAAVIAVMMLTVLIGAPPLLAQTYIVQKGDSLYIIGKKFETSVAELKTANNLQSDTIYPEQKIWIPRGPVYSVKQGDTLFLISQKFNITYGELMSFNGLLSSLIYPGQKLSIPGKGSLGGAANSRYVLGFYVDREGSHPSSYHSTVTNSSQLSAIVPFWYRLSPAGEAKLQEHITGEEPSMKEKKDIIKKAHEANVQVLVLVHNLLYQEKVSGKELARQMLATKETRKTFINQLESLIKEFGYDGVNIDIENIYLDDGDKFTLLMKELYQRLEPQGYTVTVCVPAKTGDSRSNAWSAPFDYKALGQYSHYVAVMTYDEHGNSTAPGPIASYGWTRDVAKYSISKVPPEKILLGIPGYGFDWSLGQKQVNYLSYTQASAIAGSRGVKIQWDEAAKVPYFNYRAEDGFTQVWFENASSLSHKLNVVKEFNLGGIAIWRLGLEDPAVWKVLKSTVHVKK